MWQGWLQRLGRGRPRREGRDSAGPEPLTGERPWWSKAGPGTLHPFSYLMPMAKAEEGTVVPFSQRGI